MSETSGNASMGRFTNAAMPPPMKRITISTMNSGWSSAKLTTRLIMENFENEKMRATSFHEFLQQHAAIRHDLLAGLQAVQNQHAASLFGADGNLLPGELPAIFLNEYKMIFAF